jgi:hypothetical protein
MQIRAIYHLSFTNPGPHDTVICRDVPQSSQRVGDATARAAIDIGSTRVSMATAKRSVHDEDASLMREDYLLAAFM